MHVWADNRKDFVQNSGRVHGSRVWLFLAKLLITKGHEHSLLTLTNCYLYQIRGDTSASSPNFEKKVFTESLRIITLYGVHF
jgi:hypothetical protein